jgi:hypothetical protein
MGQFRRTFSPAPTSHPMNRGVSREAKDASRRMNATTCGFYAFMLRSWRLVLPPGQQPKKVQKHQHRQVSESQTDDLKGFDDDGILAK